MAKGKLTPKQERFVSEYLTDLNGSAAYRRAGYKAANDRVARTEAARLLANPSVAAAIAQAQQKRAERVGVDQDWVLRGLIKEAEFTGEGSSHSARVSAYKAVGLHLGMFVSRHDHKHSGHLSHEHAIPEADREAALDRLAARVGARLGDQVRDRQDHGG